MRRELMAMQNNFCFRKRGDKTAHGLAVTLQGRVSPTKYFVNIESVGIEKSAFEEFAWHLETDKFQVRRRRKGVVREFVNVKRKFGSDVAVRAFTVGDDTSKPAAQLGEFDSRCGINRLRMSDGVAQIVGQSSDGKRIFVDRATLRRSQRMKSPVRT
jgi:hypothetical protein